MIEIKNFCGHSSVFVSTINHEGALLVIVRASGGSLSLQHTMTTAQALEMASALRSFAGDATGDFLVTLLEAAHAALDDVDARRAEGHEEPIWAPALRAAIAKGSAA